MRNVRVTIWVMVVVWAMLFGGLAKVSAVTFFDDGGIHNIDWRIEGDVEVWNDVFFGGVTIVNFLYGSSVTGYLRAYDSSQITISGGSIRGHLNAEGSSQITISGGLMGGSLIAKNSSQVNISGGSIEGSLNAYDSSQITISGGSIGSYLYATGNSQITISGGSIRGHLYAEGSSQVNISGGSIEGHLYAEGSSQVNISGGSIEGSLNAYVSSQITISGGSIGGDIYAGGSINDESTITFAGSNFAINGTSVGYGEYDTMGRDSIHATLTGTLANGDSLNNGFYIYGDSSIVLLTDPVVPGPYCTWPIVGDLNNDCQVDFADLAILAGNWMTCNLEPQSACWE